VRRLLRRPGWQQKHDDAEPERYADQKPHGLALSLVRPFFGPRLNGTLADPPESPVRSVLQFLRLVDANWRDAFIKL
jgi:hypothetical protein